MGRWRGGLLSAAVAVLVLAPYAAVSVAFQRGLVLQFILILLTLATARAALGWPVTFDPWPRPVRAGLSLYGVAALWGFAVGLAAGNPARYLASQTAAMLLLPLGAVAVAGVARDGRLAMVHGMAVAIPVALAMHAVSIALPGLGWADPLEPFRFLLRNDACIGGAAPLVALVLLAFLMEQRKRWALAALVGAVVLVVGIMSRGGWVVTAAGSVGVALLMSHDRRRSAVGLLLGGAGLVGGWAAATAVVVRQEQVLFPEGPALAGEHREASRWLAAARSGEAVWLPLVERLEPRGAGLKVAVSYEGPRGGDARLVLHVPGEASGTRLALVALPGFGRSTSRSTLIPLPPQPGPVAVSLYVGEGQGQWSVAALRIVEVPARSHLFVEQANLRLADLVHGLQAPLADRNLGYRARELRAVWDQWRTASAGRWVVGHGLGATFTFPNSSWDDRGRRITLPTASYIHNFYVFLALKLGVAGAVALAGLLLILVWAWREAAAPFVGGGERWPAVALAVGFSAYLLWSVTSPEIYDFRLAPLWGVVIAAATRATASPREDIAR